MSTQTELWSAKAAAHHRAEIEILAPIAKDLAFRAGRAGITVDNLIAAGGLPRLGRGREHSFLGAVCRIAGLKASGQRVRSQIKGKNGNWRTIWLHPAFVANT